MSKTISKTNNDLKLFSALICFFLLLPNRIHFSGSSLVPHLRQNLLDNADEMSDREHEYCLQNTLGYDKAIVGEFMDKLKREITRLFGWYVKYNVSLNVHNKEVRGLSDTVDLDGLETDIGNHKSLKSQFKIHKQKEGNMASKTELEKYLVETSEDDCDDFDVLR
ncbi:hypothetical protein RHSIM_Rhsim01G0100900 [Rhododendron simsii]|uniref:Uncharacterized protein n=1 Tax=Rhododendron simsii TaxID=118357 RepID=A0A834HHF8_RHOSS|nr:hypothetical protein RHSIM_Rhsim01G0100900 [Rhododendron simsii]